MPEIDQAELEHLQRIKWAAWGWLMHTFDEHKTCRCRECERLVDAVLGVEYQESHAHGIKLHRSAPVSTEKTESSVGLPAADHGRGMGPRESVSSSVTRECEGQGDQ